MIFKTNTLEQMHAADMPQIAGCRGFSVPRQERKYSKCLKWHLF